MNKMSEKIKMEIKIIYLAIPYTWNPDQSFKIANQVAAKLMSEGNVVLSPISHSHPIADYLDTNLRTDQKFWMHQDLPLLNKCDELMLIVIGNEGYEMIQASSGCTSEIIEAFKLKIPITYFNYEY